MAVAARELVGSDGCVRRVRERKQRRETRERDREGEGGGELEGDAAGLPEGRGSVGRKRGSGRSFLGRR